MATSTARLAYAAAKRKVREESGVMSLADLPVIDSEDSDFDPDDFDR
jgi:hypothetical protein